MTCVLLLFCSNLPLHYYQDIRTHFISGKKETKKSGQVTSSKYSLKGEISRFTEIRAGGGGDVSELPQKLSSGVILRVLEVTVPLSVLNIPKISSPDAAECDHARTITQIQLEGVTLAPPCGRITKYILNQRLEAKSCHNLRKHNNEKHEL